MSLPLKVNGSESDALLQREKDTRWIAFRSKIEWVTFPAEVGGWDKRQPSSGTDREQMREVALRMGVQHWHPQRTFVVGAVLATQAPVKDFGCSLR